VTKAIADASQRTGVDLNYLLKQANVESSLNPNAKARSSSATGLYQFIDQTWLRMVKNHGAEYGYGRYANAIHQNSDGDYTVANRSMKNSILSLRRDPHMASLMAAELATENNSYLQSMVGGAHFLGAEGASNFLNSMKKNPWAPAASFFPEAARANRGVFYADGRPLSLQQVYNRFDAKFDGAGDAAPVAPSKPLPQTQTASADEFERRVILPLANDWSNPAANEAKNIAMQVANATRAQAFQAFTSNTDDAGETTGGFGSLGRIGVNYLRAPTDIMFTAQANLHPFKHDDQDRYNA
jgi:hypothetical protein